MCPLVVVVVVVVVIVVAVVAVSCFAVCPSPLNSDAFLS